MGRHKVRPFYYGHEVVTENGTVAFIESSESNGYVTIKYNEPHWPFPKLEVKRTDQIKHFTFDINTVPPAPF